MKKNYPGISRIDSRNTHGWYVRVYANGTVFISKLFSDRIYGGKNKALQNALKFHDHNKMVADLHKSKTGDKYRKPFYDQPPKNNSSGIVGVNEVKTKEARGKYVHYFQATWSDNGKSHSKKFYVTSYRTSKEAFELAVQHRRQKEKELYQKWLEQQNKS